jgi:hypothetical protein
MQYPMTQQSIIHQKMLVDGTLIIESSQIAVLLAYIVTTYQAQPHRGGGNFISFK